MWLPGIGCLSLRKPTVNVASWLYWSILASYGGYKEMSSILAGPNAGGGGGLQGLSQWVQLYTGAQLNFGDLIPYLKVVGNEK